MKGVSMSPLPTQKIRTRGFSTERMKVYTASEARLDSLLDEAQRAGSVGIRRKDGQIFVMRPEIPKESPLGVPGVDLGLTRDEIVDLIHEGRRAGE